ncbi:MAG: type II secretion system F family protein [Actinomycetota bacterium]
MRLAVALITAVAAGGLTAAALGMLPPPGRRPRRRSGHSEWLTQAGVSATPLQFWATSLGAGALTLVSVTLLTGSWAVAAVPSLLVAMLPRLYFGNQRRRRLGEVRQAWPDGLRDLVAAMSAGRSLPRAIEELAATGPRPLREAFASFPFLARSLGVVPALEAIRDSVADPTTDRVVEVLIVAYERGGPIVPEILRDLAHATARDVWAAEEIETAALENKINARAVFVLPWLVLIAMTLRPGPFRDFYASTLGLVVIAVGGALSLGGSLLVSRLGRNPDEPRVLGR